MARLARKTSKLFAENATATNIGQFGSLNAGTKVETNDIATIQALPAWGEGWEAAGLGQNCYPTLQERNGLDYVQSYMTNYLYQEGIPEWDNNTTYYIGSLVKLINGTDVQLYQSIVDNNTASLSDSTAWTAWGFADKTLSNITAIDNNAQTLLNAIYANKDVAVTHTQNTAAGTSSQPVYVNSSGAAVACSGIDIQNLCDTSSANRETNTDKPAVIRYHYKNGSSWYRVWSDGWIEQGGFNASATARNTSYQVTLLKNFSNTNYNITVTPKQAGATGGSKSWGVNNAVAVATNKFYIISNAYGDLTTEGVYWRACGY